MKRSFKPSGARVAFAAALTSLTVVALAASGGIAYAGPVPERTAAQDQYVGKVTICHHTGSTKNPTVTITISRNALPAHLKHGDTVGPCPSGVLGAQRTLSGSGILGATGRSSRLPFTGLSLVVIVLIGTGAIGAGLLVRRAAKAR
jgi:hypothetical protein